MAEDAVDAALATGRVPVAHQCTTSRLKLLGAQAYKHTLHTEVRHFALILDLTGSPEGNRFYSSCDAVVWVRRQAYKHTLHTEVTLRSL
jgi:hypothetical protein